MNFNIENSNTCKNCIIENCQKKRTGEHQPGCPKDPEQQAYEKAFGQRYNGKPSNKP